MSEDGRGRRLALVMPMVPRVESTAHRPEGEPLPVLWSKWWAQYGVVHWSNPNSAKNARRCEELCRTLPAYPAPGDIVVWLAALSAGGLAPGTVAMHRDILHGVYVFGNATALARGNPAHRSVCPWKRPPPPEPHPIRNIAEVWPKVVQAFQADARQLAFLATLRFTGVRVEEGLAAQPGDVMRPAGRPWRLSVVRQRSHANSMTTCAVKGKGLKARRDIPMRPELVELLTPVLAMPPVQLRFGGHGKTRTDAVVPFLFPYRAHNLDAMRDRLGALFPEHFGAGKAWHTWRHTLAFEMRAGDKRTETIQEVLGHQSITTTEHYLSRLAGHQVRGDAFEGL